jgi:uncharacterized protein DUF4350
VFKRPEIWLALLLVVLLALAALMGRQMAPPESLSDGRLSTRLPGPAGARGLAQVLERLGVRVVERSRPFFGLTRNRAAGDLGDGRELLMVLAPTHRLTEPEAKALQGYVKGGGWLFLAGRTGVEECFGWQVRRVDRWGLDSLQVQSFAKQNLPWIHAVLRPAGVDTTDRDDLFGQLEVPCVAPHAVRIDTLLAVKDRRPVAIALSYPQGGRVTLLADEGWLTNEELKETDAGLLAIPWILAGRPSRVVVDEYHHGFGEDGSLFGAAFAWAFRSPAGWAMLQLALAGLVALVAAAIRFGPALAVVERRRRSPLEHLDALAAGLERAQAQGTAISLLLAGLKRRLSRARGHKPRPTRPELKEWLRSLEFAARTPSAQRAVQKLSRDFDQPGGEGQVLTAALAVEDVWEALGPQRKRSRSSTRSAASS